AAQTGLPIVPVGIGHDRPWRARSWDRFAVPRPLRMSTCVTGQVIAVPAQADKGQLELYRQQVEKAIEQVTEMAERWAATGRWPGEAGQGVQDKNHATQDRQMAG